MSEAEEENQAPDVPHHVEYNCATGETTYTLLTEEEITEAAARDAQAEQKRAADEEEENSLREAVKNHPDPTVQALARRLGL